MKRIAAIALALALSTTPVLTACSTFGAVAPSAAQASLNATRTTLTAYYDVAQPALLIYGRLPACPQVVLCKNGLAFTKMQATDKAVVASIVAARAVIDGNLPDAGQIAAAVKAIQDAQIQYAANGALAAK